MPTLVSSPILPGEATQIIARRTTVVGIQYTVADFLGSHTVTIKNGCIGCSCGLDRVFIECSHIRVIEAQERAHAEEAARRALYVEVFGIY